MLERQPEELWARCRNLVSVKFSLHCFDTIDAGRGVVNSTLYRLVSQRKLFWNADILEIRRVDYPVEISTPGIAALI
jgi:hypothetical protein